MDPTRPTLRPCPACGASRYHCARCGGALTEPQPITLPAPFGSRNSSKAITVCEPCHDALIEIVNDELAYLDSAGDWL